MTVTGNATVDLWAYGYVAPPPVKPTSPDQPAQAKAQSLKGPPNKFKVGKKAKLAAKTIAGAKVTWKSLTAKKCVVKKGKLWAKQKDKCTLSSKAPAVPGCSES